MDEVLEKKSLAKGRKTERPNGEPGGLEKRYPVEVSLLVGAKDLRLESPAEKGRGLKTTKRENSLSNRGTRGGNAIYLRLAGLGQYRTTAPRGKGAKRGVFQRDAKGRRCSTVDCNSSRETGASLHNFGGGEKEPPLLAKES